MKVTFQAPNLCYCYGKSNAVTYICFSLQITLSFNIRSVGKNKAENEITAGDRLLELFLHSIGVFLTSVQETEMK